MAKGRKRSHVIILRHSSVLFPPSMVIGKTDTRKLRLGPKGHSLKETKFTQAETITCTGSLGLLDVCDVGLTTKNKSKKIDDD